MKQYWLALLFVCCSSIAFAADTGILQLKVRDSRTHFAVRSIIQGSGPKFFSIATDDRGYAEILLPVGEYELKIVASDYAPLSTHYPVESGKTMRAGAFIDPLVVPKEESSSVLDPLMRPGYTLLHEYVTDTETGRPLNGVLISVVGAGVEARTDQRGHFVLSIPTPAPDIPDGIGSDTVVYKKAGYKIIRIRNCGIASEDMGGTGIEMEKGTGVIDIDGTHKLMRK